MDLLFDYGIWNLLHVESCHTHTRSLFTSGESLMHRSPELASGVGLVGVASPESAEATVEEQHLPLDLLR